MGRCRGSLHREARGYHRVKVYVPDLSIAMSEMMLTQGADKIVRLLGQGTFGKVVEARHIESRRKVAIKVIRAVQKYRDASKIEIRVLETLRRHDPTNSLCVPISHGGPANH